MVEVADLVPLWGKQKFRKRYGKSLGILPGSEPPACNQRKSCEQGRSIRFKRRLERPDKSKGKEGLMIGWKSDWMVVL